MIIPVVGQMRLLKEVVPLPFTHFSSPLLLIALQIKGRSMEILTAYGLVPPMGVAFIVAV